MDSSALVLKVNPRAFCLNIINRIKSNQPKVESKQATNFCEKVIEWVKVKRMKREAHKN